MGTQAPRSRRPVICCMYPQCLEQTWHQADTFSEKEKYPWLNLFFSVLTNIYKVITLRKQVQKLKSPVH